MCVLCMQDLFHFKHKLHSRTKQHQERNECFTTTTIKSFLILVHLSYWNSLPIACPPTFSLFFLYFFKIVVQHCVNAERHLDCVCVCAVALCSTEIQNASILWLTIYIFLIYTLIITFNYQPRVMRDQDITVKLQLHLGGLYSIVRFLR